MQELEGAPGGGSAGYVNNSKTLIADREGLPADGSEQIIMMLVAVAVVVMVMMVRMMRMRMMTVKKKKTM